jgi:hypothetical protein
MVWSVGVLECWSTGKTNMKMIFTFFSLLHHSTTPFLLDQDSPDQQIKIARYKGDCHTEGERNANRRGRGGSDRI